MSSDSEQQTYNSEGLSVSLTGQITVAAVVLFSVTFILILILYLRAKGYSGTTASYRSRRLVFSPHEPTIPRHALDRSILGSLPVTIFRSKEFEEDGCLECAVCLCELSDGEEVRLLPRCKHGFHVDCIDMWFHSNDTCPLCRSLVSGEDAADGQTSVEIVPDQSLDTGLETGCTSSGLNELGSSSTSSRKRKEGALVIDVPTRVAGAFSSANTPMASSKLPSNSPLPTSRLLEETKSPISGRMRSVKGMFSSFKGVGSSYGSKGYDIEQGGPALAESKCQ